jgi:hypothetical protein
MNAVFVLESKLARAPEGRVYIYSVPDEHPVHFAVAVVFVVLITVKFAIGPLY